VIGFIGTYLQLEPFITAHYQFKTRSIPFWTTSVEVEVEVEVTLRLTASQSVSLGVEPPSGAHDKMFFTV
jgi:hypothetical protein